MRDVMEFKVDVAYSVAKPTRMLKQSPEFRIHGIFIATTSYLKNVSSKKKLNCCRTFETVALGLLGQQSLVKNQNKM
jgi:hypothetical protein